MNPVPSTKKFTDNEKNDETLEKRISLIEHSIYSVFTKNTWDRISVYQNINRILLLFQKPLATSIYIKRNNKYHRVFDSLQDPLYRNGFKKSINEINSVEKYLCQIGNTKYYQIIFDINFDKSNNILFNPNSSELITLNNLWNREGDSILNSEYSKRIGLEGYLEDIFDKYFIKNNIDTYNNKNLFQLNKYPHQYRYDINEESINNQLEKITDITNDIYLDIYDTPLISNHKRFPPNIYFFIRYYNRKISRYKEKYNYSLQIILPPKQEEHFRKLLKLIKISKRNKAEKTWCFKPYSYKDIDEIKIDSEKFDKLKPISKFKSVYYEEFDDKECSDGFWRLINKKNGIDEIINIVKSPFGDQSRSTADPVLCSGIINIKNKPFVSNQIDGISRLEKNEWNKGFASNQVKKFVISHYIFSVMSDNTDESHISSIMFPIRIGRSTNISMGCIHSKNNETSWGYFYHYAMDIWERNFKKFRNKLKKLYIKELQEIFISEFKVKIEDGNEIFSMDEIIDKINYLNFQLCRVYPFDYISLNIDINNEKLNMHDGNPVIFEKYIIGFTKNPNPFFDQQIDTDFIPESSIKYLLSNSIAMVHGIACIHTKE